MKIKISTIKKLYKLEESCEHTYSFDQFVKCFKKDTRLLTININDNYQAFAILNKFNWKDYTTTEKQSFFFYENLTQFEEGVDKWYIEDIVSFFAHGIFSMFYYLDNPPKWLIFHSRKFNKTYEKIIHSLIECDYDLHCSIPVEKYYDDNDDAQFCIMRRRN